MKIGQAGISLCLLWMASVAVAQEGVFQSPNQPELEALDATGIWKVASKDRFAPDAPVVESTGFASVYWSASHQFLITEKQGRLLKSLVTQLQVTTWDPINKHFKIVDLSAAGGSNLMTMTVDGDVSKITGSQTQNGHTTRFWATYKKISRSESTFRCEYQLDDGPKWLFSEGTSKRIRDVSP